MSTLVFMKVLESSPSRYDRGIKLITLGKIPRLYEELTAPLAKDQLVLDLGCGTGLITLLAAHQGASVKAIDKNPEILEIAKKRLDDTDLTNRVELVEMGIAELDAEPDEIYDYIYAGLVFSELEEYEQDFALEQIIRLLKRNGRFVMIDETRPNNPILKFLQNIIRLPLVILTYIITQTTTSSVKNINEKLLSHGFIIDRQNHYMLSSLTTIICRRDE